MTIQTDPKLGIKRGWTLGAGNHTDGLGPDIRNSLDKNFFLTVMTGNVFIVKSKGVGTAPGSPADGDCYIQSAAWSGVGGANNVAGWDAANSVWRAIAPVEGFQAYVQDENKWYQCDGSVWSVTEKFKGMYASSAALISANPTGAAGDWATVDPGAGGNPRSWYWDADTPGWVAGSDVAPTTTDAVPEGATNLYFTAARVRAAVLTGFSTASAAVVTATSTLLEAIGQLQAQVSARLRVDVNNQGLTPTEQANTLTNLGMRLPKYDYLGVNGVLSPLQCDASSVLNLIGDSTGNADDEWLYRLVAEKIGPAIPTACIRYASWDDTNQIYGFSGWRTIQAGGGERSAVIKDGQSTYYAIKNADLLVRTGADLEVIVKASLADWTPAAQKRLAWMNGGAGSRSWIVYLTTSGAITLLWSPDGTNTLTATSAAGSFVDGDTYSIRVRLDVDNGAGGYTVSIHKSDDDGATWTGLLNSVTSAGTTAVFNTTADLNIGSDNGSVNSFNGNIYRVDVNDGINGPRRNPLEIEAFTSIDTNSSNVNEYGGAPTLYVLNGSNPGSGLSYFSDSARVKKMAVYALRSMIFVSTCHNDDEVGVGHTYFTTWQSFIAGIRGASPCASVTILNQNPRNTAQSLGILYEQIFRAHAHQLPSIAQRLGVGFIDTYRAFQDAVAGGASIASLVGDGVHPTIPAGQDVWLDCVWGHFLMALKKPS